MEKREEIKRSLVEQVAFILGPHSAASEIITKAQEFLDQSQKDGRYRTVRFYVVTPEDSNRRHFILEKIDLGQELMGS